jgi:hypothetical protein
MKILFVESDMTVEYNCSNWRCVMPRRALVRAGIEADVIRLEEWNARGERATKMTEAADIIFFQRNVFNDTVPTIFYWRSRGKRLVVDLDDAYEQMTEETGCPTFKFWKKGVVEQKQADGTTKEVKLFPQPIDVLKYGVKIASAVSSPSQLICQDWTPYTKSYWFPNYIDLENYQRVPTYREPGAIYLGWGGSMTHLISWTASGAADAVTQICREDPRLILVLSGDPRIERFFDIPKKRRMALAWAHQPVFVSRLSFFDIGLIPLHGEYDRRRSWIKAAEYSVMGIPWIGSDMEPTRDGVPETGLRVQNTTEAWYNALKTYVDNIDSIKEAAAASIGKSQAYFSIDANVGNLISLCERIINETD